MDDSISKIYFWLKNVPYKRDDILPTIDEKKSNFALISLFDYNTDMDTF